LVRGVEIGDRPIKIPSFIVGYEKCGFMVAIFNDENGENTKTKIQKNH
jgi:hypothetical protein